MREHEHERTIGKNKGVLQEFLYSFLFVTLIPFLIMLILLCLKETQNTEASVIVKETSRLAKVRQTMEERMNTYDDIAAAMYLNAELTSTNMLSTDLSIREGIDEINKYRLADKDIYDLGLSFLSNDLFYSYQGTTRLKVLFTTQYGLDPASYERFEALLHQCNQNTAVFYRGTDFFFYVCPIRKHGSRLANQSSVVYVFRTEDMFDLLEGEESSSTVNLIYQHNDEEWINHEPACFDLSNAETDELNRTIALRSDCHYQIKTKGRNILVSSVYSPGLNVSFVSISELDGIFYQALINLLPTAFIALVVLLCCILSAVGLAYTRYIPIRNLHALVQESFHLHSPEKNEIKNINNAFLHVATSNQELGRKLQKTQITLRQQLLQDLLDGLETDSESLSVRAQLCNMRIDGPLYGIAVLEDIQTTIQSNPELNILARLNAVGVYVLPRGSRLVLLMNLTTDEQQRIKMFLDRILQILYPQREKEIAVGVGLITSQLLRTSISFFQALEALEERKADENIAFFSEKTSDEIQQIVIEDEVLLNALLQKDRDAAIAFVEELIQKIRKKHYYRPMARSVFYQVIVVIQKAIQSTQVGMVLSSEEKRKMLFTLSNLPQIEDIHVVFDHMKEIIEKLCISRIITEENDIKHDILQYVDNNYTDNQMSLDMLVNTFGRSAFYWSRFFSEKVGVQFSDYLWKLRLDLSKRLLSQTNIPISQIVQTVGYSDQTSFSRKFKKSTTLTPGQYRTLYYSPTTDEFSS